jgi:hypothetical protein
MFHYCGDGMTDVVQQPRARIPLLWSEVKERCNALSVPEILALGSESKIAEVIHLQVLDYTYTYPTVMRVSGEHLYLCELIPVLCQNGSLSGLVQRTRPYRNCYGRLAVVSDVDGDGVCPECRQRVERSAVLYRSKYNGVMLGSRWT